MYIYKELHVAKDVWRIDLILEYSNKEVNILVRENYLTYEYCISFKRI